jgi:2-keto-4-pentenoate hydratase/2-oxohepta-3-ene-1,7-dioic acid hydratase in catechol pathway
LIVHVGRFRHHRQKDFWGIVEKGFVRPIDVDFNSTGAFLKRVMGSSYKIKDFLSDESFDLSDLEFLSPITKPCRVICQGKNYLDHLLDTGIREEDKQFNMFFNKSSASIVSPGSPIFRPVGVRLLDYEIELGLVIKAPVNRKIEIDSSKLQEYVGGLIIGNDISARDIQLPQSQFFKGKSYRSFCPLGPFMAIVDGEDMKYIENLTIELKVNGLVKQSASTSNMIYKPHETLSELSHFSDLDPGDVILTGTPKGTALSQKKGFRAWFRRLLSESKRWELFIKDQEESGRYLKPGDIIESRIFSSDGKVNLGLQRNTVVDEGEANYAGNYL